MSVGLRPCQVVFPDNRITILSLFTVSEPVGWIKHCIVDSAGATSRKEFVEGRPSKLWVGYCERI